MCADQKVMKYSHLAAVAILCFLGYIYSEECTQGQPGFLYVAKSTPRRHNDNMFVFYKIVNSSGQFARLDMLVKAVEEEQKKWTWFCHDVIQVRDCLQAATALKGAIHPWFYATTNGYDMYCVDTNRVAELETKLNDTAAPLRVNS